MTADHSRDRAAAGGITLALVAFAGFSLGDAVIKSMAGDWPAPAVAALRFAIGALALAVILFMREGRRGFQVNRP